MGAYILIGVGIILALVGLFFVLVAIHHFREKERLNKLFGLDRMVSSLGLRGRLWMRLKLFFQESPGAYIWRPLFIGLILIGGGLYLLLTFIGRV